MAIPAIPTAQSLVIEGLRQARIFNPTSLQIATYQNEVMEQLKNDLWQMVKQAKPLMTFSYLTLTPGQSRYSCPSDFSSDMTMTILTGLVTGQAVTASANTLTVPTSVGSLDINQTLGKDLAITGGTAANSVSQIIGVVNNINGTTTLTVYPNFQATPDASSTFMLIDSTWPCTQGHIADLDYKYRPSYLDRPKKFYSMGDEDFDEFVFDCAPDNVFQYVARMRYCVNIMTLDINSQLMSTLYQKFRQYWIKGIKEQALSDNDDTEALTSKERESKLLQIVNSQIYGTDIRDLQQRVEDYM